jgi:(heptosyl)LPS beta-1,4-glucosyltransferase
MPGGLKISVVICCVNAEDTLDAACRSVSFADEIVVVDSGSTDGTEAVARRFAHVFHQEPWRGYTEQKKFATALAKHDWVFVLDADEECSPELAEEIAALSPADAEMVDVFEMRRLHYLMGRRVRAWSPDWQRRLVHRHRCRWTDAVLHDDRRPGSPGRLRRLQGRMFHKRASTMGFRDWFNGSLEEQRLILVALDRQQRGRRFRVLPMVLEPWAVFIKSYLLHLGFLDGTFGFLVARQSAAMVHLQHAALWAAEQGTLTPARDTSGQRACAPFYNPDLP